MKIYFMHIPKCGGTSIHHLMDSNYDLDKIVKSVNMLFTGGSKSFSIEKYDVYHEHSNIINRISDDFNVFTILRSPRERLVSLMNHWLSWTDEEILNGPLPVQELKFSMKEKGFEGFLDSDDYRIKFLFQNGMAKALLDVSSFDGGISTINKLSDDELFNEAKKTLDRLDFVGLVERFEDSINCLCEKFNWLVPQNIYHSNRRDSNSLTFSNEINCKVENYISVDKRVYEYGANMFEKYHENFKSKLLSQLTNYYLEMRYQNSLKFSFIESNIVEIDFSKAHAATGFHEREGIDIHNVYRWAGQCVESKVLFSMPIYNNSIKVKVHSISRMKSDFFNICSFFCNGQLGKVSPIVSRENDCDVFEIKFENVPFNKGVGEFVIYSPERISHNELDPLCPDKRLKSVAVNKLVIMSDD